MFVPHSILVRPQNCKYYRVRNIPMLWTRVQLHSMEEGKRQYQLLSKSLSYFSINFVINYINFRSLQEIISACESICNDSFDLFQITSKRRQKGLDPLFRLLPGIWTSCLTPGEIKCLSWCQLSS